MVNTETSDPPSHIHFPHERLGQKAKYPRDRRIRITPRTIEPQDPPVNRDDVPMDPSNALPHKWICKLVCRFTTGGRTQETHGTGFLLNIPGSSKCVIVTARHVLARPGTTHARIIFPGRNEISVDKQYFRFLTKLDRTRTDEWDYSIILLPDPKDPTVTCGFGFDAAMLDRALLEADLSVFGYPGYQMDLWGSGGRTQSVGAEVLQYLLPTSRGQSGSPVFMWHHGLWTVVGIHVRSEQRVEWVLNYAVRLNVSVMKTIVGWIGDYQYLGRALCVGDRYLRRAKAIWYPQAWGLEFGAASGEPGEPSVFASLPSLDHSEGNPEKPDEPAIFDIIPVHTFPEGSAVPFSSNRWVILCRRSNNDHISICIDPYAIGGGISANGYADDQRTGTSNIGTCEHLRESCILRRAPEFVTLSKHNGDPKVTAWGIKSVRFPDLPLRVMNAMRWVDGKDTWDLHVALTDGETPEAVFENLSLDISDAEAVEVKEDV